MDEAKRTMVRKIMEQCLRRRDAQMSSAKGWKKFAPEEAKDIAPGRIAFYVAMARANNREALYLKRSIEKER